VRFVPVPGGVRARGSAGVPGRGWNQYTILIPEHLHIGIHGGGQRGGLWNQAWRDFRAAQPEAPAAEIYRYADVLLYRFQLTGPIVPYHGGGKGR